MLLLKKTVFIFILFLTSCSIVKFNVGNKKKSIYETFFISNNNTQYFIYPLVFKSYNEKIELDFTFRDFSIKSDSAICNFSIKGFEIIKSIDSLYIDNEKNSINITFPEKIFIEKNKKTFQSRFTSKIKLTELIDIFKYPNWQISIFSNDKKRNYLSSKKTNKKIIFINEYIFNILS